MSKILVTGANGYIGQHVVKSVLALGHEVIASDLKYDGIDPRAQKSDIMLFSGDSDIYKQFGCPDAVIHLAWRNGFVHNADTHITDLPNHYVLIKNLIEGGLKNLTVMGTMHEVGYWEGAITPKTPTNPTSNYGIAKNALRQLSHTLADKSDVSLKWLRAYYITGDDIRGCSIFSKITQAALEGKKTFPLNSGKNKYDFISVYELADQIAKAGCQTKITGEINCCSGIPISLGEQVQNFVKENNYDIKFEFGVFPERPYDSPAIWGDASKIKQIMNN